jgi:hypothetical protein
MAADASEDPAASILGVDNFSIKNTGSVGSHIQDLLDVTF